VVSCIANKLGKCVLLPKGDVHELTFVFHRWAVTVSAVKDRFAESGFDPVYVGALLLDHRLDDMFRQPHTGISYFTELSEQITPTLQYLPTVIGTWPDQSTPSEKQGQSL
jgi:hypothetical protein